MPLFDWSGIDVWDVVRAGMFAHSPGDAAAARVAAEIFRAGIQPDEVTEGRLARSRWLEENGAAYAFPCGVVPEPEPPPGAPRLNVVPLLRRAPVSVIAAVLPSELVFIVEQDSEAVVELGRLPRGAIRDVDVVDANGTHLPEPVHETFEPETLSLVVLTWTNAGVEEEEERFAFRSAWLAWRAARRLREAIPAAS
jgi:hypothetical protein